MITTGNVYAYYCHFGVDSCSCPQNFGVWGLPIGLEDKDHRAQAPTDSFQLTTLVDMSDICCRLPGLKHLTVIHDLMEGPSLVPADLSS